MTTRFYVDANGDYLGGFGDGAIPPVGAIEVQNDPPPSGKHRRVGGAWVAPAPTVPVTVPKYLLIRALKRIGLNLTDPQNPTWRDFQSGDTRAFPGVRTAMWAATWNGEAEGRDEWEALIDIPRSAAAWGYLDAGVRSLMPDQATTDAFLDFVFLKAATV